MNYSKSITTYFTLLLLLITSFQTAYSQTISPPFQEVPVPPFPFGTYYAFFDVTATGDWYLTSSNGSMLGTGNQTYQYYYQQNQSPNPTFDTLKLYDPAQVGGRVSSITITPNIVTFPSGIDPNNAALNPSPYYFGDPIYPAIINVYFQNVGGNDYEVIPVISNEGFGYTDSQYPIRFTGGGRGANITSIEGPDADGVASVFMVDDNGELRWNTGTDVRILDTSVAGSDGDVQYAGGIGYLAPPDIDLSGWTHPIVPTFQTTVIDGRVTSVEVIGSGYPPNTEFNATINIVPAYVIDINATVNVNNPSTNLTPISTAVFSQRGNNDYYSVTGKVFRDANGNQVQDAGEDGIPWVRVRNDNPPYVWGRTDAQGNYTFNILRSLGNTVSFSPLITEATPSSRTVTLSAGSPVVTGQDFAIGAGGTPTGRSSSVGGTILPQNGQRIALNQNYSYQVLLDNPTSDVQTVSATFTPDSRFEIVSSSENFEGTDAASFSVDIPAYSNKTVDFVLQTNETIANGSYVRHSLSINTPTGRLGEETTLTQQIDESVGTEDLQLSLLSTPSLTASEIEAEKTFTYHIFKGDNAPVEAAYTEMVIYLNEEADMSKLDVIENSIDFRNVSVSESKTVRFELTNNPSEANPLSFVFNLLSEQTNLRVYSVLNYYDFSANLIASDVSPIITTKVDENPSPQQLIGVFQSNEGTYLDWIANDGFTNFVIARKAEGDTEFIEVAQTTETNWIDTNVQPSTTYIYKVRGNRNASASDFSNDVTIQTDETVTGIEEVQTNKIILYPNPSQDIIHYKETESLSISHIEIVDLLGNIVLKTQNTMSLDISRLKKGMYVIRFISDKGTYTKTFCKI
ncbi:T9SS type A sorting domain-containing protein [Bernardetia sp.]|uniref:T9SS type A sorting domain-containing protein n=1 Tax=Bernardetia sp. TaxID=1937974 RepID=UPI0025B86D41|nr:T9SS type A sorting domain-containing protein [Bernardetia sp.]